MLSALATVLLISASTAEVSKHGSEKNDVFEQTAFTEEVGSGPRRRMTLSAFPLAAPEQVGNVVAKQLSETLHKAHEMESTMQAEYAKIHFEAPDTNAVGATIAFLASILSNMGTNPQRAAHMKNDSLPVEEQRAYIYQPFWWCGFVMTLLGAIGDFWALALASQVSRPPYQM